MLSYRITLALVRSFGHVPHLSRAILRSFQTSYVSTDLLMSFSYSSLNLSAQGNPAICSNHRLGQP